MPTNRQWKLASRPIGWVEEHNFTLVDSPIPEPADGEVLVKNLWLSLDPYMRGRISDQKSYAPSVAIGEVMVGATVGAVKSSRHPDFKPGDNVLTQLGWQEYGCAAPHALTKVDGARAPLSYYLGLLGMPGLTAYFGLREIGRPMPGETVVVSAASGAVGSVVGQLAKIGGCRTVGIAGGAAKCRYVVEELGLDGCIDHKRGDLSAELKRECPAGVDVYFDNVGGPVLDAVLPQMNIASRLVVCGAIADYNSVEPYGVRAWRAILTNRIRVQGMIVFDWRGHYGAGLEVLAGLYAQGRLKTRESIVEGIERAAQGLIALMKGQNFGKQLVKLG
jgi:NADPH-dependent curcumin reductase CurA